MEETKAPRKTSNAERKAALLKKLDEWVAQGMTKEEAVYNLTPKQYDFLVDQDVNLDEWVLTAEQVQNLKKGVLPRERRKSPEGYNKKYPKEKMELFTQIREFVESLGGEVIERPKNNYRDLDFMLNNVHYKIVLSNPRT